MYYLFIIKIINKIKLIKKILFYFSYFLIQMGACTLCQNLGKGITEVQINNPNNAKQKAGKGIKRKQTKFPKNIDINDDDDEEEGKK